MSKKTGSKAKKVITTILVLVSMLMTSVVKLRIINTIGSIIFTIYLDRKSFFLMASCRTAVSLKVFCGYPTYSPTRKLNSMNPDGELCTVWEIPMAR